MGVNEAFHPVAVATGTVLGFLTPFTSLILAVFAGTCIGLAVVILLRTMKKSVAEGPAPRKPPAVAPTPTSSMGTPLPDDVTEETDPSGSTEVAVNRTIPRATDAHQAEKEGNYERAADLWRERGDILREREALLKVGLHDRLARIELALGHSSGAIEPLKHCLADAPADDRIRLELVRCYLDTDHVREAEALIEPLLDGSTGSEPNPQTLVLAGMGFEAVNQLATAQRLYRAAITVKENLDDVPSRLSCLEQLERLARADPKIQRPADHEEMMSRALEEETGAGDSAAAKLATQKAEEDSPSPHDSHSLLEPYRVVVGHLALGGMAHEPVHSVRSVLCRSARFEYVRLVGERPNSAVFECVDRLLDCPVAMRLSSISTANGDFEVLRDRLVAISQLNHPNLSKVTYVDRFGRVIRVVSEYHGGGNLITLVNRLDQIGLPLMLRILVQICSGLAACHRRGILHGDLRPENIMIGHDNLVKLVDFALQPWPLRSERLDESKQVRTLSPTEVNEIQSDIIQFADVIEFLLGRVTVFDHDKLKAEGFDPIEELRELLQRARNGSFSTVQHVQRILLQVLERVVPGSTL